jgi:putative oxidoreductase
MKIVALISRILLGLIFVVFGSNGFLHFIPMGPLPAGPAGQFLALLFQSHYVLVVCATQVLGGALLLVNRYVPFALTILGPVIVNILCYHFFMTLTGLPLALFTTLLWFILFFRHISAFSGIFAQRTA